MPHLFYLLKRNYFITLISKKIIQQFNLFDDFDEINFFSRQIYSPKSRINNANPFQSCLRG
jgi:hypothetical protein